MSIRALVCASTLALLVGLASADVLPFTFDAGEEGFTGNFSDTNLEAVEDYITIAGTRADDNKDGFLEAACDVNPLGYVMLHFRARSKNVRVVLGDWPSLLATDISLASNGSTPHSLPELPSMPQPPCTPQPPQVEQPPVPPSVPGQVPEPATLGMLVIGGLFMLRRRIRSTAA